MGMRIKLSAAQIARVSTVTKELLLNTPVTELRNSLLIASQALDRIGREMQQGAHILEDYLKLEKRMANLLREIRILSKELRLWEKSCHDDARAIVLATATEERANGVKPESSDPSRYKPEPPPTPDGYVDHEVNQLTQRMQVVAEQLEKGQMPDDQALIEDVLNFARRTGDAADMQLQRNRPPRNSEAVSAAPLIEGAKQKPTGVDRPSDAQAGP
ncbi:MAG: hypothetical protein ACYTDT_12590 [Planctomycetota bacterium]|jgi:hypothetical protein